MGEIPKDTVGKELVEDGKYSVHNWGMYQKNYFQGKKLLIIMLYTYGMIDDENEGLSDRYITESKDENECIQSSIDYTGKKCEVVTNYEDAINKLIDSC